ncbi:hypothetical protein Vadar_026890 [Vaccinium darrowii]|uniref:Uncharacterized protein n=1 Tax=Vaccinium darrowii TaxID=229202 RepID=A0ACB7YZE7_9ERIC|nr:hypothetical protein Vadar_026890 [Vaccinium darrowii]
MSVQPPVTANLPIEISSEHITTEEEDHLIRSTKKVKNDHDYSVDMAEDTPEDTPKEQADQNVKVLSFKQALTASRGKEIPFSKDVETIPLDEEIIEEEENIDDEEEIDGIPVVKIPKSLLNYGRQLWKNAIIVKPIGYPIGYKSLCTKVKSIWDLQGDFSALEIGLGFVVFKFDMSSHRRDQCSWGSKPTPPPAGEQAMEPLVTTRTPNPEEKINLGNTAQLPAYGQWTLVQRRPNTGKRFTDRNQLAQNNKAQGPNAQKQDTRGNRYYLLNWFEASTSNTKRPHPVNKNANEPKASQPTWAKVKNGNGSKHVSPTQNSPMHTNPTIITQPDPPPTTHNNSAKPNFTHITPPSPLHHPSLDTNPNHQSTNFSPKDTLQPQPNGNRDVPPPPSANLHLNQTRGRSRSTSKGHLVDSESQDGDNGPRLQCSRSPVLCGGSGKPERYSSGPDGNQETCGME